MDFILVFVIGVFILFFFFDVNIVIFDVIGLSVIVII